MLSDAVASITADTVRFLSPYSGSSIYADELAGGATIEFIENDAGYNNNARTTARLSGAPSGLEIASSSVDVDSFGELYLTLRWTGTSRTVAAATTVSVQITGLGWNSFGLVDSQYYTIGSFTINPTPKQLVTSTPTNSSTVTEAGSTSTFTVRLRAAPSASVTVAVTSGDTSEGSVSPSTMTFTTMNWSTPQTVTVTGASDSLSDGSVSWNVVLNPASPGMSGDSTYDGLSNVNVAMTTTDEPVFSIDSPSVAEGDSGMVTMTFTVTLSASSTSQHTVNYARTGGTATSGTDYTAVSSSMLTFTAGTTTQTITVSVTGDTVAEGSETVVITLSNPSSGTAITTAVGTGTIVDDDREFSIDSPSVTEGDTGSANLVFTVTVTPVSSSQVTVDYAQGTGGTATSGTDFTASSATGTLTFPANTATRTITVSVTGDTTAEGYETVVITLSNPSGGTISATAGTGTGTIMDNDLTFSIDSPNVAEGDSGFGNNLVYTVTLSASVSASHSVRYGINVFEGTAAVGADWQLVSALQGTLTFAANETTKTITMGVRGDTADEGNETVVVRLLSSSTVFISTAVGTGTILDDDPKFSIDSPSVTEGDSGQVNMTFTVTLSGARSGSSSLTVDYAQTGGTATSGTDYTAVTSNTLTFATGVTTQTFTVSVTGDTTDEADETVVITLSNATTATGISTATGTGTIRDDDPKFSIDSPTVTEGGSPANLVFTVSLSASSTSQLTVDYALSGTASSGTDYTAPTGTTLTFAANTTSQTITVPVTDDTLDEVSETVVVTLSNPSAATGIATATGTGTILDNDPQFSIDSPTVTEGDNSSVNLDFTVTLSASSSTQLTVGYAQTGGTATSGTDYTAVAASTLTFAAGTTSQTIRVSVTGDTTNEANETVIITLSNPTAGAGISTAVGTGTITDNDTPGFSVDSPSVTEGDSSSQNMTFTVTLSPASYQATTVDYATTTTGTATVATDFTATSGTLSFGIGETSKTFMVSVAGDTNDDGASETVVVQLSNAATGTNIATATGTGTITDNDPKFSIANANATEGDSGSVNMTFTVSLSGAGASQYTVNYASSDGTATAGTDYTAVSGTLTFAAGTTSQTFTVSVTGDANDEANETLTITLSDPSAGTAIAAASATGTIIDNDTPGFSINSPSVAEGDSSTTNLTFTVTLSPTSFQTATVNYATTTTGTATVATDFTATSGTLTFAAGTATQTITVTVSGDATYESDETVIVTLSNASAGTNIATTTGTGTITNDDPGLSIANASVTEGDSNSVNLVFTVTMSPAEPNGQVTVNYASADGSTNGATAGTDYTVASGTLTFAANETSKTITVSVTGDTENERDETVTVTLSSPSGAALVTTSATGTIIDNDTPGFSIDSPSVAEGDTGDSNDLVFTVSLSPESYQASVTVNWAVTSGTATSGTDYTGPGSPGATSGTLTFAAPNKTSQTITMSVMGDLDFEENETVVVTLSGASTGTAIVTASGTGTITNEDPGISIDSPTVEEVDEDETATLEFTVTLSPAPTGEVTVDYADAGTGTAESGVDYTAITAGTLTFAATETSKTIEVSVIGDVLSEPDETVVVTLSNPNPLYTLVTASGTGTIEDNDELVQDELDMEIVTEVAREVTTSVVTAVSNRVASVAGGAAIAPPVNVPSTGGFADGGLLSILAHAVKHDRERDRGLERSEMSLYRSLDDASFAYSPSALGATGASGGGHSGILTVWGSVDYRKMSGSGEGTLTWDGELASLNIGTDTLSESGVLVGVAVGASKGSFGYQGSIGGTSGVLKIRVKTLNPYVGWSLSESASLWASVGYGRGKINYNDEDTESSSGKMKLASAAFGGRYRLFSADGSADSRLIQVNLKGEAWGLQNEVEGDERRPLGSKSRSHGVRVAVETYRSGVLESGASLLLSGEAGVRWDGGDGDTGTGFEMGGTANYGNSATGMKVVATTRVLLDHESGRKEWGAGLTVGSRVDGRETGMTYSSSLSHGQVESEVDSLWDSSAASRTSSEEDSLATRLDAEVGYRFYGSSGLHTPYVGFGAGDGSTRDYRVGMRYAGGSAVSSGMEFERRETSGKRPDHRVMLTGQMNW